MATDDLLRLLTPDRPAPIYPLPPPRTLGIAHATVGARDRVLAALRRHGAATTDDIVRETRLVRSTVRWALLACGARRSPDHLWRLG